MKNRILKTITVANMCGLFVAISFADSPTYVPYICMGINAAWLALYMAANKGREDAWDIL